MDRMTALKKLKSLIEGAIENPITSLDDYYDRENSLIGNVCIWCDVHRSTTCAGCPMDELASSLKVTCGLGLVQKFILLKEDKKESLLQHLLEYANDAIRESEGNDREDSGE